MSAAEAAAAEEQRGELTGSIHENDAEIARVRAAIDANDAAQASVQRTIDAAIDDQRAANPQLLKTLKQFRLQVRLEASVPCVPNLLCTAAHCAG